MIFLEHIFFRASHIQYKTVLKLPLLHWDTTLSHISPSPRQRVLNHTASHDKRMKKKEKKKKEKNRRSEGRLAGEGEMCRCKVRSEIRSQVRNVRGAGQCTDWMGGGMERRRCEEMDEVLGKFGLR